jgi:hypothetical protein
LSMPEAYISRNKCQFLILAPMPPSPLPPAREGGAEGRVRAPSPKAAALGYDLTPLPGLRNGYPKREDFVRLLLTQDTSSNFATNRNSFVPCLRVD